MIERQSKLYKLLQREASAPDSGFDSFIVGKIQELRAKYNLLISKMLTCEEPSQVRLVLGPNGTGKTLLNNIIMEAASSRNVVVGKDERVKKTSFEVLFSRIALNEVDPSQIGIQFASNLKRSVQEPSNLTYASIATKIADDFVESYKPPLGVNLASVFIQWPLKRAVAEYQKNLEGLIQTDDVDLFLQLADKAYKEIQKNLSRRSVRKAFQQHANTHQLNSFLRRHFVSGGEPLSLLQLNKWLTDDLTSREGVAHPLDSIKAISDIAKDVECRLLVLMLDDFNAESPPRVLLPVLEALKEFNRPKLLLVVSGVDAVWDAYKARNLKEKSFIHKLDLFGSTERLSGPSEDETRQLLDKLISLMQGELQEDGEYLVITNEQKDELVTSCPKDAFRTAIKYLIDHLEQNISAAQV